VPNRETLFISDLHLTELRPDAVSRFMAFLTQRAPQAERLVILGDLFDAYLGDDDLSSPRKEIRKLFKQLTTQGTEILFQPGNRDFLVGRAFAESTGVRILDDHEVIDLYGDMTLLMHGDLLCTDDVGYLTARQRIRTPEWRAYALGKPLWLRKLYARWYRFKSGRDKGGKTLEIMDANPEAIQEAMLQHGVKRLIHGHTHRPGIFDVSLPQGPAQRFVLPEWNGLEWVLVIRPDGISQESLAELCSAGQAHSSL
jgi:UDP-2,3-diacylglucosamine hydrolase